MALQFPFRSKILSREGLTISTNVLLNVLPREQAVVSCEAIRRQRCCLSDTTWRHERECRYCEIKRSSGRRPKSAPATSNAFGFANQPSPYSNGRNSDLYRNRHFGELFFLRL